MGKPEYHLMGRYGKIVVLCVLAFGFVTVTIKSKAVAFLPGQVIVDPDNPSWLKYSEGGPFFMSGPGDPEGFLYRGSRNFDGTRSGDQLELLEKLKGTGANCIYLMAVRSHGGDGDCTQNPFVDSDASKGLDADILNQWESWFSEMDRNGIVIFFIFYDDSAKIWDTGNLVGSAEKNFIHDIVNRFEHHRLLIWCVAEEYEESYSAERVKKIAEEIRAADNHDHVIAVHKLSGLSFSEFADEKSIDQFAIQFNVDSAKKLHNAMVYAWKRAKGRYNLNMAEVAYGGMGSGEVARKKSWAIAMGGAYVMINGMDIENTSIQDLKDHGRMVDFFESTNFNEMEPHDELRYGGTEYVMALPGKSYIAYASSLTGDIGLKNMVAGKYSFKWYDLTNGKVVNLKSVDVISGNQSWTKPASVGNELAVYINRVR
jgi:hypothetical protein